MSPVIQLTGSIILACVPAAIWGYTFYKKQPQNKRLTALTFVLGALAVFPILLYKFLWQFFPAINVFQYTDQFQTNIFGFSNLFVVPLSVVLTFMIVGVIEEIMKLSAVKVVDESEIQNIDDSIEFFIIAALGFSFTENILYFYNIWENYGLNNLFLPFVLRSSFSTFAHILFSGILGYYYGTAHFAKPILQEELRQNRKKWTIVLHKIFSIRSEKLFYQERLLEGLFIAVTLHALFNIFLELNFTFMILPFLVFGYFGLNHLIAKKENHINYDKLLVGERSSVVLTIPESTG